VSLPRPPSPALPWIVSAPQRAPQARVRVLCFPHAGGGATPYFRWAAALAPTVEVLAAQLPGREARYDEPLLTHLAPALDALDAAVLEYLDKPLVLFGHSMGALFAFEFARRLRARRPDLPHALCVSARQAPQLPPPPSLHQLPEEAFIAAIDRFGGTPKEVWRDPELRQLILRTLRADLALLETHPVRPEPPLACPLLAYGGQQDPSVPEPALRAWSVQTRGPFQATLLPGGHHYLHTAGTRFHTLFAQQLAELPT
jgi:medium-chain acyl-[acyl-carrier-protein] hydrolase